MNEMVSLPVPLDPAALKREWWRALRAIARLARRTDDTAQVFEILHALNGDCLQRTLERMRAHPQGARILRERPSLNRYLKDPDFLAALPEGSLGRAYLDFMRASGITAEGLVAAQEQARRHDPFGEDPDPERRYVGERLVEMHDLWHVLSGYGSDDTGELANLWFSYGQFGQLGMAFIAALGSLDGPFEADWWGYMHTAHRRGRRAELLVAMPLEELLDWPLARARKALGIDPPEVAHPGGIRSGNRRDTGIGRGARLRAA